MNLTTVHAPAIAGLAFRSVRSDDVAAMARIANRCNEADGLDERHSAREIAGWLLKGTPQYDPAVDLLIATVREQPIAFTWLNWVITTAGIREYRLGGWVDPDWVRRGIGRALLEWTERRAADLARPHGGSEPLMLGTWTGDKRVAKTAMIERAGYRPARWFFEMIHAPLGAVELPRMPDGLEIRPVTPDQQRAVWDADVEAFRDHWGGFDDSDESYRNFLDDPNFNPDLFVVAWDGDQVAGAVLNAISVDENQAMHRQRGWLESVFVRRPWRRRGLAAALVARSLVLLRETGMTEAMLGVDADNPSGALHLYENAGFVVHHRGVAYRKPLELDGDQGEAAAGGS